MLDQLETWLTSTLGKGVIRALDTPNFVANRIGVFSILAAMHHTARLGLGFDEVDALTGPKIGRPKSATYRTADVVGLDTLAHVIGTMDKNLADDPWHRYFKQPEWLAALISKARWARKRRRRLSQGRPRDPGAGPETQDYRPGAGKLADEVGAILKERDPASASPRCAPAAIRRPSSCGACSATSSTTAPRSWPTWPTMPATWTWPCAGASAGPRARSRPGRPPAGNRSPRPWPRTSPPAAP